MEKSKNEIRVNDKINIIVWLDFDAYSYINFAVITELIKLDNFDIIGIVTKSQSKISRNPNLNNELNIKSNNHFNIYRLSNFLWSNSIHCD